MPKVRTATARQDDYDDEPVIGTRQVEARTVMRETRDAEVRPDVGYTEPESDYVWRRPTALDAPPPRQGMVQRWVSMKIGANQNNLNWSMKFTEGWRPRDPASIPDEWRHLRGAVEGAGGTIQVGGLVLCEIPEFKMQAKRKAIQADVRRQELSVSTDTDAASREGARYGAPPVVREDRTDVEVRRRPSTALAD